MYWILQFARHTLVQPLLLKSLPEMPVTFTWIYADIAIPSSNTICWSALSVFKKNLLPHCNLLWTNPAWQVCLHLWKSNYLDAICCKLYIKSYTVCYWKYIHVFALQWENLHVVIFSSISTTTTTFAISIYSFL